MGISNSIFPYNKLRRGIDNPISYTPQITNAVWFKQSDISYQALPADKLGVPLTFTYFVWFKIPSGKAYTTTGYIHVFGNHVDEDVSDIPGIAIALQPQDNTINSNFRLTVEINSWDGFNGVRQFVAQTRNVGNTANTHPIQRDVWYSFYMSININDINECELALGPNGTPVSMATYEGDTDPAFPAVPFLPTSTSGSTTYRMGVTYSRGGGEADCDNARDSLGAYDDGGANPVFGFANTYFFQPWAIGNNSNGDQSGIGHLRFVTATNHPIADLGINGETPFAIQPDVYFIDPAASYSHNSGFDGDYSVNAGTFQDVAGPT